MVREGDAGRNFKKYLGTYVRPEFIDAINFVALFKSLPIATYIDEEDIYQDVVDRFIDRRKGGEVRALLEGHADSAFGEGAGELVGTRNLRVEDKGTLKKMVEKLTPLLVEYIKTDFKQGFQEWLRRQKREKSVEDFPEVGVPPEHEVEQAIRDSQSWENGLIDDVLGEIESKVPEKKRALSLVILKDMFLSPTPKTLNQIEAEFKLSHGTVHAAKVELTKILAKYLTDRGLGGKFLEEGGLAREEIELPPYRETFSDPDNVKEFKSFVGNKYSPRTEETTKEVVELFGEGKSVAEIMQGQKYTKKVVDNAKQRYFDKWYKEWYEGKVEKIRKAGENMTNQVPSMPYMKVGEVGLTAVTVRVPYEKVVPKKPGEPETETEVQEAMKSHKAIVVRGLARGDMIVTITFSAEYDNGDLLAGKKNPGDPAHFRFEKFEAEMDESRMFGRVERSVNYMYTQRLNDDGTFMGTFDSRVKLDGKLVPSDKNELQKLLDGYMDNKVKPEGMLPHGHFSTIYVNDKTKKKYVGVRKFVEAYRGILTEDKVHKDRTHSWERLQVKKKMGPMMRTEEEKVKRTLFFYREELKKEEAKRDNKQDKDKIKEYTSLISDLEETLKSLKKDDLDEHEDLIVKEMRHRMEVVRQDLESEQTKGPEERDEHLMKEYRDEMEELKSEIEEFSSHQASFEDREAFKFFPKTKNGDVEKLEALFKKYNQKWPDRWLNPRDMGFLAKTIREAIDSSFNDRMKQEISKGEMSQAQVSNKTREIQEEMKSDMEHAAKLFKAVPGDLKVRLKELRETAPEQAKTFEQSGQDLAWVDSPDAVITKVEEALTPRGGFPPPEHENVKALEAIFKKYGQAWPSKWIDPKELEVLARTIRKGMVDFVSDQTVELKRKVKEKDITSETMEEQVKKMQKEQKADLESLSGLFDAVAEDLKSRLEQFKKSQPEKYRGMEHRNNVSWVSTPSAITEALAKVHKIFKEPVPVVVEDKSDSITMLEEGRYRSLEAFLEANLSGMHSLGQVLEDAPLQEVAPNPAIVQRINREIAKTKESKAEVQKILEELAKSEEKAEDIKEIEKMRREVPTLERHILKMERGLETFKKIPALGAAEVLLASVDMFSPLYGYLTRILWFHEKPLIRCAEDKGDLGNLESLRSQAVHAVNKLASKNIFAKASIKAGITEVRTRLNKFIKAYNPEETEAAPAESGSVLSYDSFYSSIYRVSAEGDLERARVQMIFPADELTKAEQMIHALSNSDEKKVQILAPTAKTELDTIIKNVTQVYKEGFSTDRIRALADREKIPFDKAKVLLKRLEDAVAKQALSEFILKWQNLREQKGRKEKERSPLGNRPGKEYEEMNRFVETHIPEVLELAPSQDDLPEDPERGVPTPKEIRERIEHAFTMKKPMFKDEERLTAELGKLQDELKTETEPSKIESIKRQMADIKLKLKSPAEMDLGWEEMVNQALREDFYGGGGSGGGGGKSRAKAIKPPPPSATHENLMESVVRIFDKSPKYIVLTTLSMYAKRVRDHIKELGDGEYLDPDAVVDALVSSLKNLYSTILKLNITPSSTAMKVPPSAPGKIPTLKPGQAGGMPDIPINNLKEAEHVFDHLVAIYKEINHYIAPDSVGIPSGKSLGEQSKSQAARRFMPHLFMDWLAYYQKQKAGPGKKDDVVEEKGGPEQGPIPELDFFKEKRRDSPEEAEKKRKQWKKDQESGSLATRVRNISELKKMNDTDVNFLLTLSPDLLKKIPANYLKTFVKDHEGAFTKMLNPTIIKNLPGLLEEQSGILDAPPEHQKVLLKKWFRGKKADDEGMSSDLMAYNVALKFAGTDFSSIENLTESEILTL
jgi:hypothetical protein